VSGAGPGIRLDKWLWHARFFKTRGLCAKLIKAGHLRVNATRVSKASATVRPGDVLTFAQADEVRVIEIVAIGTRRGPASEAITLYTDLSPPVPKPEAEPPVARQGYDGKGRPTKKNRRLMDRFGR
jgi:ribosome-associated heat shock protein Hsp15